MEPLGIEIELTEEERKLHGLNSVLMTPDSPSVNGWVANIPRNKQLAGDVYMERNNPHYGVEGRPSSGRRYSHTLTDLHNAGRAVISHRTRVEHETAQLRQDIAQINAIRERLGSWSSWSEAEFERYSAVLELVTVGHLRDLDPSKQAAVRQLIGSNKFTDSLGRRNPGMVSWRLPTALDSLERRQTAVRKQFGTSEERRRWLNQCQSDEKRKVGRILELIDGHDSLAGCRDEFLQQARRIRFRPYVQAVNKAWHTIDQPQSALALRESLVVFCELYGALMRPMSIVAAVSLKDLARLSPLDIGSFVLLVESLHDLLPLASTDEHYLELASQLAGLVDQVVENLAQRDFKAVRAAAKQYRFCLHYHGSGEWNKAIWCLPEGMEWPSLLPPDFDPFAKFDR